MNRKYFAATALGAALISLWSCASAPTQSGPKPTSAFPRVIGAHWRYALVDSLRWDQPEGTDTVDIRIVATTTAQPDSVILRREIKRNHISPYRDKQVDTETVIITSSEIEFLPSNGGFWRHGGKIIFPSAVGDEWGIFDGPTQVLFLTHTAQGDLQVGDTVYTDVSTIELHNQPHIADWIYAAHSWFSPQVGIVSHLEHEVFISGVGLHQTAELIEFIAP
ncbi:MAG TPA: hypothetical protein VLB27_05740 [candidate division Zixibacteria bacterium]|nr:hypothetical protein [candidate division Zixibacteria bacterium]